MMGLAFNDWLFVGQALVSLSFVLFCFRLGKMWMFAYIAMAITLMNIFVLKQSTIFGFDATLGNVLYASIFFATDLLSEHYGKSEAFRAVRVGFVFALFSVIFTQFALAYVPNDFDFAQGAFETLFTLTPRVVLASLATYLVTQHLDVWIFHRIKSLTQGRYLWLRNNVSTLGSQLLDSFLFTYLAFYGVFDSLISIALFTFLVKMVVAILDTPFLYFSKLPAFEPEEVRQRKTFWGRLF